MGVSVEEVMKITVVHIPDKFVDTLNALAVKGDIEAYFKPKMRLILDLSDVEYLDSAGLGTILACMRHLFGLGGKLKIGGANQNIRSLFELVRFNRIIDIFPTVEEALQAFERE